MWIKKSVATVVLFAVVLIVPLQTLAQIEPRITYEEWCDHLDQLHRELEAANAEIVKMYKPLIVGVILGGIPILLAQILFQSSLSLEDLVLGLAMLGGAVELATLLSFPRAKYQKTIDEIDALTSEIENWERAGGYRMWFYPCEEE